MNNANAFADFRDDLDAIDGPVAASVAKVIHSEICKSCNGRGSFVSYTGRIVGKCFKCGGAGKLEFKTPSIVREKARHNATARKVKVAADAWVAFKGEHPTQAAFLEGKSFDFAVAMVEAVRRFGSLTVNQMAAVDRCIARDAERAVAKAAPAAAPVAVDASAMQQAFDSAKASGLRKPTLRAGRFDFSMAPDHGRNPGAIYCRVDKNYMGMIVAGGFKAGRDCSPEMAQVVAVIASNPKAAAMDHGRITGNCSCCGRELTDPVSVANGIGPICAQRFGW